MAAIGWSPAVVFVRVTKPQLGLDPSGEDIKHEKNLK
jgi:hypothetical protein